MLSVLPSLDSDDDVCAEHEPPAAMHNTPANGTKKHFILFNTAIMQYITDERLVLLAGIN